jgi:hypothetical protein
MYRVFVTLALAVALNGSVHARDLELVEGAYELSLEGTIMPGSTAGSIIFRPCEACDTVSLRVGSGTQYSLDNRPLALTDFLAGVDDIRNRDGAAERTSMTVYYSLQNEQVTRISVQTPRR